MDNFFGNEKLDKLLNVCIGKTIREMRTDRNMSLETLGNKIGKSKKTVQRYETAESRISMDVLDDIAKALNVIPDALILCATGKFNDYMERNVKPIQNTTQFMSLIDKLVLLSESELKIVEATVDGIINNRKQ
mgnify:CR=1 FL=1